MASQEDDAHEILVRWLRHQLREDPADDEARLLLTVAERLPIVADGLEREQLRRVAARRYADVRELVLADGARTLLALLDRE